MLAQRVGATGVSGLLCFFVAGESRHTKGCGVVSAARPKRVRFTYDVGRFRDVTETSWKVFGKFLYDDVI